MTEDDATIRSWHAHVYFDAASRDAAWVLRKAIEHRWAAQVEIGRFHERLVGPHPCWSFQIALPTSHFAAVVGWLVLNHGRLDVFVHPETGDTLTDHRDRALWIGRSHPLDLSALGA